MAAKRFKKVSEHVKALRHEILKQLLTLSTSGFSLVAALAWNEAIKETVTTYIKPYLGQSSGLISLVIYAVVVTILAVIITFNLTKLVEK